MHVQSIISNFPMALKAREFVVYYQPKVDISQKKCCGAEALVRWVQNGNVIAPGKFVPQLEQEGSICQLDYYVLEEVCRFQKKAAGKRRKYGMYLGQFFEETSSGKKSRKKYFTDDRSLRCRTPIYRD